MGQSDQRVTKDGRVRWTAVYLDVTGARRSAGTFASERQANRAWQRAEAKVAEGRQTDVSRGRQNFRRYVVEVWFPSHRIERTTRQNYAYFLDRYILPAFGGYGLNAILPVDVRRWVDKLEADGTKPSTIKYCLSIMSAIFTTALNDQLIGLHPTKGVKGPAIPSKTRRIITPEQFDAIHRGILEPVWGVPRILDSDSRTERICSCQRSAASSVRSSRLRPCSW